MKLDKKQKKNYLIAVAATIIVIAIACVLYLKKGTEDVAGNTGTPNVYSAGTSGKSTAQKPLSVPNGLPTFKFYDPNGKPVHLSDYRGDVILLNLWATWCTPCVSEMASLDKLQAMLGPKGLRVIAISMDKGAGAQSKVRKFIADQGLLHLKSYYDTANDVAMKLPYAGIPATFLIARDGKVVESFAGPHEWHEGAVLKKIEDLL